jgi:integrase
MEAGDITPHTYDDYVRTAALVSEGIGQHTPAGDIGPDHFERLLQDWNRFSPVHRGNMVCRAKTMFGYCWDCGMLEKPVRFGPHFKRPPRRSIRQAERRVGKRIFTAEEIHRLLSAADPAMIAMILLGINCGYENHDIAKMVISDYHPENGWLDVPRPKTEIPRRCRLWPETIEAINHYLPQRKQPVKKEWNSRLFITSKGYSFWRETYSPLAGAFTKLTRQTGIHRPRMGFLWLRHTFATVAGDMADTVAIKHIMGHADHSMLAGYTHGIDDARLIAVSEHVRRWLFG